MIKRTTQFSLALSPSQTLDVEACQLYTLSYSHSFFPAAPVCLPNLSPAAKSEPHPTFTTISMSLPGCAVDILKFQNSILCSPVPQSNSNSELISMNENTGSPSNTVTPLRNITSVLCLPFSALLQFLQALHQLRPSRNYLDSCRHFCYRPAALEPPLLPKSTLRNHLKAKVMPPSCLKVVFLVLLFA